MSYLGPREVNSSVQDHTAPERQCWDPDTSGLCGYWLPPNPKWNEKDGDSRGLGNDAINQRLTKLVTRPREAYFSACLAPRPLVLVDRPWFSLGQCPDTSAGFCGSDGAVPFQGLEWVCDSGTANPRTLLIRSRWLLQGWAYKLSRCKHVKTWIFVGTIEKSSLLVLGISKVSGCLMRGELACKWCEWKESRTKG